MRKQNIQVCFKPTQKINLFLRLYKDTLPKLKTEGIYLLKCDCGKCYVGQTGRTIECRIKEHERNTINRRRNLSAIAEHAYNNPGHKILFNEVKVLTRTEKYIPRIIKKR